VQEVTIRLRFNRVCLGSAKRRKHGQVFFGFDRDPANRVMFMPAAWLGVMRYAAKLANKHHSAVQKIDWCPVISGSPRPDWRRTIVSQQGGDTRSHFAVHEAFPPGDTITVSAVVPEEISLDDFEQLLSLVGKYKGFSPFNNATEHYGTFEVISIKPVDGYGDNNG
jgi:hypothetical protein